MKILAVHQGAEVYGSDRSFLTSIKILREAYPNAQINIILHEDGPLRSHLESYGTVRIHKVSKLSYAEIRRLNFKFLLYFIQNFKFLASLRKLDVLYINTIVILDFIFLSRFIRRTTKSVIHVREIQQGFVASCFKSLLTFSKATLIFNSERTHKAFYKQHKANHFIVENGVEGFENTPKPTLDRIKLLIVGRINDWKGQDFFLKVIDALGEKQGKVHLRIVGSVFSDQTYFKDRLTEMIKDYNIESQVQMYEFTDSLDAHFEWSNVVVVPSKKPEPFGRVAIEGMSAGRALIVADHGGLSNIVDHEVTGLKFKPNDVSSAKEALEKLIANPDQINEMGSRAKEAFRARYSENVYKEKFLNTFKTVLT